MHHFVLCCRLLKFPFALSRYSVSALVAAMQSTCVIALTTSLHIYYLIDALCEFSKNLLSHPVPRAVPGRARRGNCLCAKGLRRRFRTPKKYFSGELSNWPNPALFETAYPRKRPATAGTTVDTIDIEADNIQIAGNPLTFNTVVVGGSVTGALISAGIAGSFVKDGAGPLEISGTNYSDGDVSVSVGMKRGHH